ncbi:DNA-3-methyladenine glycosylase 2 family protein [Brevibacterium sp. CS2]|nr:DNA-3-methyladenine glycosylase 2 family protein [Brevibacterium sp. CS2]
MSVRASFRVDASGPFDREAARASLAVHAVEGLHLLEGASATMTRWVDVHGDPHAVTVRLDEAGAEVATSTVDAGVNDVLAARVRHWFDLDADVSGIDAHLGADPLFAQQVRERPGLRISRFQSPFEAVVMTVMGQQVTLRTSRLFDARLVAAFGAEPPAVDGMPTLAPYPHDGADMGGDRPAGSHTGGLRLFPTPDVLAAVPLEELRATVRLTGSRARTVHEVAVLFAEQGDPDLLPTREDLHAVHGIGPWTLDYLAIRAGTDADAFPAGDAVLRRTLRDLDPAADADRVATWSPHRSYAAARLWAHAS